MAIDRSRLAQLRLTGAHWTAGSELLDYLKKEADWDPTPEQHERDDVLVRWLSGEMSHDEATRALLDLTAKATEEHRYLSHEAHQSLQGLLRPIWSLAQRAKNRELEREGHDIRPRPRLAVDTLPCAG